MRPGRIDKKVEYRLATVPQAKALFLRFFPLSRFRETDEVAMDAMAQKFSRGVPEDEFSTAELQGYLLSYKKEPVAAAEGICGWIACERRERIERAEREEERRMKLKEAREKYGNQGGFGFSPYYPIMATPRSPSPVPALEEEQTKEQKVDGGLESPPATP